MKREVTGEEIKRIELDILKDAADFCEKNGLRYILACGTALGAVRHGGFIPWDDDVDIAMPRPDYDRFLSTYESDKFDILSSQHQKDYPYAFAKVVDRNTELVEQIEKPFPMGVYIDVFPVDGVPETESERKKFFRRLTWDRRFLGWKRISPEQKVGAVHKVIQIAAKIVLKPMPLSVFVRRVERDVSSYPFENATEAGHLTTSAVWGTDIKPKELFEETVKYGFEGMDFCISKDYDRYLTLEYGDYMTLPPKEKQVSNHDFTVCWKE